MRRDFTINALFYNIADFSVIDHVGGLKDLQEKRIRPVGSNREIPLDFKVIAATNRNLEEEIAVNRFREDLYYRINVIGYAKNFIFSRFQYSLPDIFAERLSTQ